MNAEITTHMKEMQKDALKRWHDESDSMHPLELFPYFRRFKRSAFRTFIYTIIFNGLIAAFFTVMALIFSRINSLESLGNAVVQNLIISNIIGFSWAGFIVVLKPLFRRINEWPLLGTVAAYTVLGFFITQAAFLAISYLPGFEGAQRWTRTPQWYVATFALAFLISLLLGFTWRARMNAYIRDAMIAKEQARLQEIEKQAAQANLRALQAQIEPHFLFNTLANVTGLIHTQPDKAKQMLEQFIAYLRATLAATREHETTIAADFETMKTFLSILQIRMGERLKVRFDLPDALRDVVIPPMLLQPLVENAIKHGLEPKMDGGEVALSARRVGNKIAITVADTGLGFQNSTSNGIGLKNVRERVKQLYGDAGSVSIEENQPSGTRITIEFQRK
jgi:sensor histidine kinase YesM